ncbi:hypothetical protein GCM10011514_07870 [Emticicia aquatilis]|uniref:N-acetyltransferase domain-containing protein n=1 Tax=Emticicia aquatilis TaxID=1537369 RepID=A0A916YIK0_9BACT|nr:GNAT family N-acetyltransferase [Emticicia aquatilis]GGD46253.1 hypothetical protein GCM10011514_07870 [Emticicia aquatilis]
MSEVKINKTMIVRQLESTDFDNLLFYLEKLSAATRSRFAPHAFDLPTIKLFYATESRNTGFIIDDSYSKEIVAYTIIKLGYVPKDKLRLEAYQFQLQPTTDCTFAPSVADAWQGKGLGNLLFDFIKNDLRNKGIKRVILWGGVQASNAKAINYYSKQGFRTIGKFVNKGIDNFDMVLELE